jgi:hypothetical protein
VCSDRGEGEEWVGRLLGQLDGLFKLHRRQAPLRPRKWKAECFRRGFDPSPENYLNRWSAEEGMGSATFE